MVGRLYRVVGEGRVVEGLYCSGVGEKGGGRSKGWWGDCIE